MTTAPGSGWLLAVDAGGTKTDLAVRDLRSGAVSVVRTGALPFSQPVSTWVAALDRWLEEAGGRHRDERAVLVVSSAGLDLPTHGHELRAAVDRAGWSARTVLTLSLIHI